MQMEAMSIDLHGHLGNRNLMKRYLLKLGHQELSLCVFSQYSVSLVTLGRKTTQANKDVNKSMTRTPTQADTDVNKSMTRTPTQVGALTTRIRC